MYEGIKSGALRLLKVPPEPTDPMGEVKSLRVFRASKNYYKYKLYLWALGRVIAIPAALVAFVAGGVAAYQIGQPALTVLLAAVELFAVVSIVVHSVVSYVMLRLDYEMRWYKVTDRSLRIREGVWSVREMTMTFANIQNISVTQGPIQRLLGISDLRVQTAGGGGAVATNEEGRPKFGGLDMHTGYFRGVDNAGEIRQLILERLRRLKDSGLGDTDEPTAEEGLPVPSVPSTLPSEGLGNVLGELRAEAAALRRAATGVAA